MSLEKAQVSFLRAVAHPLRLRILSLLTGAELSAAEVARELGTTHANASYHLRFLERAGEIEVVGTTQVRGGTAKRYGYNLDHKPPQPDTDAGGHGQADLLALVETLGLELRRRTTLARDEPPAHFADAEVWVQTTAVPELVRSLGRVSAQVHRAARPPRTEGCQPLSYSALLFAEDPDRW